MYFNKLKLILIDLTKNMYKEIMPMKTYDRIIRSSFIITLCICLISLPACTLTPLKINDRKPNSVSSHFPKVCNYLSHRIDKTRNRINRQARRVKKYANQKDVLASTKAFKGIKSTLAPLAHSGQTILLILGLTFMDLARQQLEVAGIKSTDMDIEEYKRNMVQAKNQIINSTEIWNSILGAGIFGTAAAKPLAIFNKTIQNSKSSTIIKNFVTAGVGTFITFLGWEFFGQIINEATNLIEDDDDYEKANQHFIKYLRNIILNYRVGPEPGKNDEIAEELRIVQMVIKNIGIVFSEPELRSYLLFNLFRERLATGHFTTLVASMVTASAVGTTLFPGAGTVLGAMFGLVGGVISIFIPHSVKDKITDSFWEVRVRSRINAINDPSNPLIARKRQFMQLQFYWTKSLDIGKFQFNTRPNKVVNDVVSILMEKLYRIEKTLFVHIGKLDLAREYNNIEVTGDEESVIEKLKAISSKTISKIIDVLNDEYEFLNKSYYKFKLNDFHGKLTGHANTVYQSILSQLNYTKASLSFFQEFKEMYEVDFENEDVRNFIHSVYFTGYIPEDAFFENETFQYYLSL